MSRTRYEPVCFPRSVVFLYPVVVQLWLPNSCTSARGTRNNNGMIRMNERNIAEANFRKIGASA